MHERVQGARPLSRRRFAARERALAEGIVLTAAEIARTDRIETLGFEPVT